MKFSFAPRPEKREKADLVILPFWEGGKEAADISPWKKGIAPALSDFKGRAGETVLLFLEERVLLLGLGKEEKANSESLRRAYSSAVRAANRKKAKSLNVLFPRLKAVSHEEALRGVAEGILLSNYAFTRLKGVSLKENPSVLVEKICWIGLDGKEKAELEKIETVAEGVNFVRDLVNDNSDDKMPQAIGQIVLGLQKKNSKLKASILDKKRIEAEEMGLLLAVNRASKNDPVLACLSYRGDPKSKEHIVLVGKGITYDTGGLQIKPPDGMMTMKADMAGAATVLGAVHTAAELGLKVNVTAVAPLSENSIGSGSYKLGDVYRSKAGKTVEVNNTDAEGRLVLADAITYAIEHLKPTCLVDLATLTGSMVIALGEDMAGLFSNDETVAKDLLAASDKSGEMLWRMPLHADYKEALKSEIADMLNTGGRDAGCVKAALFLHEFVGNLPWAHLDIAGPAFMTKPKHYNIAKGTGYGLRLLIDFLEGRAR